MIAWGKNKSESRVTAEFYNCAIEVMRGAEAIDRYEAMDPQEAFDIEYWSLEEAKLRRLPPEKELDRRIVVVVGAGAGIGKATAHRLVKEGAHVVCVDREPAAGRGDGGRDRRPLRRGHRRRRDRDQQLRPGDRPRLRHHRPRERRRGCCARRSWPTAGLDAVVVTAGVFVPPGQRRPHRGPAVGAHVRRQRHRAPTSSPTRPTGSSSSQGLPASVVLTTSANAVVAKKGSLAYDTSKAAANHLVRELAVEMAPLVRVNAVAPATVVKGSTMFPRERVIASLAKYEIAVRRVGDDRGAARQARRVLRASARSPARRSSPRTRRRRSSCWSRARLGKTTGHVIPVDGGLQDGFLR